MRNVSHWPPSNWKMDTKMWSTPVMNARERCTGSPVFFTGPSPTLYPMGQMWDPFLSPPSFAQIAALAAMSHTPITMPTMEDIPLKLSFSAFTGSAMKLPT